MEDELKMLKDILYKYALVEVPSMENEAYIPESNFEEIAKAILTLIRKREIEVKHKMDLEMQDYYGLANVTDAFVALREEHPLYESIRQDVLNI
jgi:hypothetical protein